ncbi:MAG TPA: efflux RND transporter periplasmic adaptor subunit [Flavisolibacter sp.]|nr:efflux RND transporter periplasmic adaptor subunit [Flavisolibacter sp.]
MYFPKSAFLLSLAVLTILSMLILAACSSSSASETGNVPPPQALPVLAVTQMPSTVYQEYSASLEGSKDIEIRPQVEGYIESIYVDEGAAVRRGQVLFKINDRLYREQVNNAKANLAAAKANLATAQINVSKIAPLVEASIVSDVQLKSAQAAYNAAAAQVTQAQAMVRNAEINLGYTRITAPADGYIGRIPMKTGSLVGMGTPEPLTVLSELKTVYAYFSLSETDFLRFKEQYAGATVEEKIKRLPPVELVLADGSSYAQKGKVEVVSGLFTDGTGSISFRAAFPNPTGQLRSGNTGRIRLPLQLPASFVIPQEATFELQDKVFVFVVGDSNKVASVPLQPSGRSGNYYLVKEGIKPGTKIVYAGLDRLRDGAVIQPQPVSMDSLLKSSPL